MRLKNYLQQISPLLSSPEAVRRLLRIFAAVLSIGILSGAYNFLLFTFNNDISQRRGYMSSAIAEAHTFFTIREALLESLSLSAVRHVNPSGSLAYASSVEEVHFLVGEAPENQWSIWLTRRMSNYLAAQQVNLLYVGSDQRSSVTRLFNASEETPVLPSHILLRLHALRDDHGAPLQELWLTNRNRQDPYLYIFKRLDRNDPNSGWLALEMNSRAVSDTLSDQSAGEFMMLNADGMLVFSNMPHERHGWSLFQHQRADFFGFVGDGLFPDHLVIRKSLMSSDWQLVYSIGLADVLLGLWKQLLGALLFCVISIAMILLLMRRFDNRLIKPTIHRIQALIESESFSRDLIQMAPVALCVVRRSDAQMVLENQLAQQWLGTGDEREALCRGWIRSAFMAPNVPHDVSFVTSEGRHLRLSSVVTRYKSEDVLLCVFSDISASKQAEAALESARQSADAANAAKTLFLATMSHEIRTPLYGVQGTLELLARTSLDAQQREYLRALEGSSATLLQLICDVLDVSKIEAGQLELEVSEFSPTEIVQEVIQGYSAAALAKGLELYACLDPQLPLRLQGDHARIQQILNNLVSNAVKFTDYGRVVLRVQLLDRQDERSCLLWQVTDNGRGIAEEDQPYIFEPFYQTEGSTNVVAGSGLGLAICQRLSQLMNGQMRMVSDLGLGTSFSLLLPLEEPALPMDPESPCCHILPERIHVISPLHELAESLAGWLRRWGARAQVGLAGAAPSSALLLEAHPGKLAAELAPGWTGRRVIASADGCSDPRQDGESWYVNVSHLAAIHQAVCQAQGLWDAHEEAAGRTRADRAGAGGVADANLGLNVLVAEDNVINQLILRDQLQQLGCSVVLATDGEEALRCWHEGDFDIVLSDVNMPGLNGYELAKALRREGSTVPIIGATANAMRGEDQLCMAAGMNHCLIKPFTLQALFHCLVAYQGSMYETP
ncbi:response regulator [Achromobacter insolitus]|uniref:ATP-binding protein n=1 Tax=Achromobacter insolitus TaxID=217204 RepID=UPI0011EA74A4|nr:ATP-binding protein [Achromobacter insolitus]QEK94868.1 response regulator [Achromobacter insolitus]